jgi:hypothetical protein
MTSAPTSAARYREIKQEQSAELTAATTAFAAATEQSTRFLAKRRMDRALKRIDECTQALQALGTS